MTIAELKTYADRRNINVAGLNKKKELVGTILQYEMPLVDSENGSKQEYIKIPPLLGKPHRSCVNVGDCSSDLSIFTICSSCGEEIYAGLSNDQKITVQKSVFMCPKCGSRIKLVDGNYVKTDRKSDPNSVFAELHKSLEQKEVEAQKESIQVLIDKVKNEEVAEDTQIKKRILSTHQQLKQYLLFLIHIETEIFQISERLSALELQEIENKQSTTRSKVILSDAEIMLSNWSICDIDGEIDTINEELAVKQVLIPPKDLPVDIDIDKVTCSIYTPVPPAKPTIEKPRPPLVSDEVRSLPICPEYPVLEKVIMPTEPMYASPGLFNKKRVIAENAEKRKQYESELEKYNQLTRENDKAISAYNLQLSEFEKKKAIYDESVRQFEQKQQEYCRQLKEYESARVLYLSRLKDYEKRLEDYEKTKEVVIKQAYQDALFAAQEEWKKERLKEERELNIELLERKERLEELKSTTVKKFHSVFKETWFPQEFVHSVISTEKRQLKSELKKIVAVRNRLYAYDIIYRKYRNLAALTTIYEYLDSGRCSTLDGPYGAYNLLESETRANEVIILLNNISDSLNEIKANQYLLFRELSQVNQNLLTLNGSMNSVIDALSANNSLLFEINSTISSDLSTWGNIIKDNLLSIKEELTQINQISRETSQAVSNVEDNTHRSLIQSKEIAFSTEMIAEDSSTITNNSNIIAYNTAAAAHYSAITAHYSKVDSEMTEALAWITALK